jgi:hypothetical protein
MTCPLQLAGKKASVSSNSRDELPYRLRQQSLLGEFGRSALQTRDFRQILQHATELSAQGLEAPFAKVLEYLPNEKRLLVRSGVGWAAGATDNTSLGADVESPAGFAYHTGKAVISNHLQEEMRFRTPQLLADHGVRRAINVLIERGGEGNRPLVCLKLTARSLVSSTERTPISLRASQDFSASPLSASRSALEDAGSRVATITQVMNHLWRGTQIGFVELADFMGELCKLFHRKNFIGRTDII